VASYLIMLRAPADSVSVVASATVGGAGDVEKVAYSTASWRVVISISPMLKTQVLISWRCMK
jgi:hypothetical protein